MKELSNYKKASTLLIISIGLTIVNSLFIKPLDNIWTMVVFLLIFLFLLFLSILVRKGITWIRYFILFLIIWGTISYIVSYKIFLNTSLSGIISFAIWALQLYAGILLLIGEKKRTINN